MANSTENQHVKKSRTKSASSSSEEDNDIDDEDESKIDTNIPDDEKFFVDLEMETNANSIQPNNMMDIFRRQSSNIPETNNINNNNSNEEDDSLERNESNTQEEPILSSTPERDISLPVLSDENQSRKVLTFTGQDQQENGEMNSDDDDDDLNLQDNFSFLIAKGMLKPS